MDHSERYWELCRQGRAAFLQHAAPAALVRLRGSDDDAPEGLEEESTVVRVAASSHAEPGSHAELQVYPLIKKPGAPFSEMITVGRTSNNDVVLNDVTISRFHAYFKKADGSWLVCDSGSKNGTRIGDQRLDARKETPIQSRTIVKLGELRATFYTSDDLYALLAARL